MSETRIDIVSENQFKLFDRVKRLEDLVFLIGLGLVFCIPLIITFRK